MKVLYITRKFPPSIGGMQTQSYFFHKALSRKSDVLLISWGSSQLFLPFFIIYAAIKSIIQLTSRKIDIIQLGDLVLSPLGVLLKLLFNKPVLAVSHGRDSAYRGLLYNFFVIGSAKKLNKIICVSDYLKQRLRLRGLCNEKLEVIPNGISVNEADELSLDREQAISEIEAAYGITLKDKKIILSVSRLIAKKGIKEFIDRIFVKIISDVGNAVFLVVGDGPEKIRIAQSIKKFGLEDKVCLTGSVKHNSCIYEALFSIADVFVMPNIRVEGDAEGFGVVALESSVRELPIVAYGVDGIGEAVHNNENGMLIEEGNEGLFIDNLLYFLRNKDSKQKFGEKAKKYTLGHFGWDIICDRYIDQYKKILNK